MTDPAVELEAADDLWRRERWRRPPVEAPTRWGPEGAAALTVAYSYVINRVVPSSWYVPANLTAAAAFVALAAYDNGFALELRIEQFFHGHKECIHIDVEDKALGRHPKLEDTTVIRSILAKL